MAGAMKGKWTQPDPEIPSRCTGICRRISSCVSVGVCPDNFAGERFHLFGQDGIGIDGQAHGVAYRVSCRVRTALCGFRTGTGTLEAKALAEQLDNIERIDRRVCCVPIYSAPIEVPAN